MSNKTFSMSNNYHGLEEALEAVMREDDSDIDVDLVALPPEPSVLTDEEEGDDDDVVTNEMPRDIPGSVEVFVARGEEEWDCSDDEPLASRSAKKKRTDNLQPNWRKCNPIYSFSSVSDNTVPERREKMVNDLRGKNPTEIFETIFDDEVMNMIIVFSKLYAAQKNKHDFDISVGDLKSYFGILLLSGYHTLPRERLYWSYDEDCNLSIITKAMSRNKYLEIKKFLHLCDNAVAAHTLDKMFKVRPLADILMKKFMQWGVFHENLSIDESMVKYFGRHPSKQFIRGKPVRFGYKNWMLASADGYCYAFDIYCGKFQATDSASSDPLGTRVVKGLLNKLDTDPKNHIVFFDNFFTSFALLRDLRETGYRATGTVREGRTNKCPLVPVKEMKKKNRADFDYRFDKVNEILFVRWLDNSVCTMGTNYDTVLPLGKVKRWSSVEKSKIDSVEQLSAVGNASAGFLAAFFSSFTLCPTELIKCQLQAMREVSVQNSQTAVKVTPLQLTQQIFRQYGIQGLFRGLVPTIMREMPGYFFFFGGYEGTRELLKKPGQSKDDIGFFRTMIAGAVGGLVLWTIIFPSDVIKSRVQISNSRENQKFLAVGYEIIKKEGVLALYNGLKPTLVRTIPATAALFVVYEYSKKFMHQSFGD